MLNETPHRRPNLAKPRYIKANFVLSRGGVIAYPTESVYGLGCDPFDKVAVARLLTIKQRLVGKGLIVVAANIGQFLPWIANLPPTLIDRLNQSWPGPITWVVPLDLMSQAFPYAPFPYWITGDFDSVALRVSDHPIVRALCEGYGGPLVSTSANLAGCQPLTTAIHVRQRLGRFIDNIVVGATGNNEKPTTIKDLLTGKILRQ
ncbi:MAG: Sua5/YciO/YrdC/YwlC family protein [Pseudomonadales bacterium]|nr:Sua5/YciO/YrdC/YwlC family protein [Pseudomonadales bacterium]